MTFPAAGEPRGASPEEEPQPETPAPVPEAESGGSGPLAEKPVLEWTTEDWARWIEEPPVTRPASEPEFFPPGHDERTEEGSAPAAAEDDPRIEGDPTGSWPLVMDEDEDEGEGDTGWWFAAAGLEEPAPVIDPPPVKPPGPPIDPPGPPIDPPAPPIDPPAPPIDPPDPPVKPPGPPIDPPALPIDPPTRAPRAPTADVLSTLPQGTRRADAAPSPSRRVWEPEPEDLAVRVRAGLSLLGVSVLVGAVTAGVITVALFMAAVVLRRALG